MISVAMTTYNGAKFVAEQLESILNQSLKVDEVIIYDDGSNDTTRSTILNINDSRVSFYQNKENVGFIKNFQKAIAKCQGDYIFLADQDDIWEFDKVEKTLNFLHKNNCEAVCTNFSLIDEDGKKIDKTDHFVKNRFFQDAKNLEKIYVDLPFSYLVKGNVVQGATYCIKKSTQKLYLEINNETVYHDHQLLLIAAQLGNVSFLNEKLIRYRIHGKNTIGFGEKSSIFNLKGIKIPKIEPSMVTFLKQLNRVSKIENYWWYIFYYYFRIPSIKNIINTLK